MPDSTEQIESTRDETASAAQRPTAGAAVEIRGLTVRAGGRVLLHDVSARFEPGKVTLIVGPSGVGKSVLLRVVAGLIGREDDSIGVQGVVEIDGRAAVGRPGRAGVVFQGFALFDELSPLENVRFAFAHRLRHGREDSERPAALLDELDVPRDVPTAAQSGGQRQRLAIARTLAQNPAVILYDEPTSGLDAATAQRVAAMIRQTHAVHPQTSVIVTHDYESLSEIADAVFLLAGSDGSLREIARADWPRLREMLAPTKREPEVSSQQRGSLADKAVRHVVRHAGDLLAASSKAAESALLLPLLLIPFWKSPLWGLRWLWHYLRLVAGPSAMIYLAVAGAIAGFVTTYFTFRFLPYKPYTEPLLIEELLMSTGFALYRILTPILATILIAARSGAAAASDLGGKSYGGQLDAMRTIGVRPSSYLATGVLYAFLLGTPLLVLISYAAAAATSLAVFTFTHGDRGPEFWSLHYHARLAPAGELLYVGTWWLLLKVLCCAAGTALIAHGQGTARMLSGRDVSRGITRTILWATLWVLAVHFVFAFLEF